MDAIVGLLNEISTPVKIGWVMWIVWGTIQIVWYQRTRTPAPAPVKLARKRSTRQSSGSRKSSRSRRAAADVASSPAGTGGCPEFLAGLGVLDPQGAVASEYGVAMSPAERSARSRS